MQCRRLLGPSLISKPIVLSDPRPNGSSHRWTPAKSCRAACRSDSRLPPELAHRTPFSYIFDTRSVGFLHSRPDTKCVPVRAFSDHKLIRFLDCQVSQKVVREQLGASALRATCGDMRDELRAGGRSAPSPGLSRGGVGSSSRLQYQRLAVAAALRTFLVVPTSRNSPLKMGPRGTREALALRRW